MHQKDIDHLRRNIDYARRALALAKQQQRQAASNIAEAKQALDDLVKWLEENHIVK